MRTLQLCDSLRAIWRAVERRSEPSRIVRILNYVTNWHSSTITLTREATGTTLRFSFDGPQTTDSLLVPLTGVVPEALDAQRVVVAAADGGVVLADPRRCLAERPLDTSARLDAGERSEDGSITFSSYHREFIPTELQLPALVAALERDTFLQVAWQKRGVAEVSCNVLGVRRSVRARPLLTDLRTRLVGEAVPCFTMDPTVRELQGGVSVGLQALLWAEDNDTIIRQVRLLAHDVPVGWAGSADEARIHRTILRALPHEAHGRHLSYHAEVSLRGVAPDLDGVFVQSRQYKTAMDAAVEVLQAALSRPDAERVYSEAVAAWEREEASLLHARQLELADCPMVKVAGKAFYQVPRCEQDLVALFLKLEGAAAFPLANIQILEYTPRHGTDAIGHVQLLASGVPRRFALIEFELHFESFLKHGHSAKHVDFIICWDAARLDGLIPTERPWHQKIRLHGREIDVITVSHFPSLEIDHA